MPEYNVLEYVAMAILRDPSLIKYVNVLNIFKVIRKVCVRHVLRHLYIKLQVFVDTIMTLNLQFILALSHHIVWCLMSQNNNKKIQ